MIKNTQQMSFEDDNSNDDVYSNSTFTEGTEGNSTVGTASLYGDDDFYNWSTDLWSENTIELTAGLGLQPEQEIRPNNNNASLSNWLTDLWSETVLSQGIQPELERTANLTRIDTNNDGLGSYCIADLMKGRPKWKLPSNNNQLLVYWSEGDVSQENTHIGSCSQVLETDSDDRSQSRMIQEKIKIALLNFKLQSTANILVQFWAPIKEGSQCFLTTSDQPFGISQLDRGLCEYRIHSRTYEFNVQGKDIEGDLGVPGRVFRHKWPEFTPDLRCYSTKEYPQKHYAEKCGIRRSFSLPLYEASSGQCVGVLEFVDKETELSFEAAMVGAHLAMKAAQLTSPYMHYDICKLQIDKGLQFATDEIHKVLKVMGTEYKLPLAQAWVPYTRKITVTPDLGKNYNSFDSSYPEEQVFTLSSVYYESGSSKMLNFRMSCREHLMRKGQGVVGKAFLLHKPCFCTDITKLGLIEYPLAHYACHFELTASFALCLCSTSTGNCEYVLELFLPTSNMDSGVPMTLLSSLLAVMKQNFQSFKVACGDESVEELSLEVITSKFTTKNEEKSNSAVKCTEETCLVKTSERELTNTELPFSYKTLQQHFGKKLEVAAESLGVSRSTLKRVCREQGISRWPSCKRNKVNRSTSNFTHRQTSFVQKQSVDSSKRDPSCSKPTEDANAVIVKAKYGDDMIRFRFSLPSGMEKLVENVTKRLNIQVGSFRLKYEDDDGDLILITCDEDLQECMDCTSSLGKTTMKILVHPLSSSPS